MGLEQDIEVKTLSACTADKEGHSADVIFDVLFRVTLGIRFRPRGKSQGYNMDSLIDSFLSGHKELSTRGLIATADRGYGSLSLLKSFLKQDMSSVMIMPNRLLHCHPFAPE